VSPLANLMHFYRSLVYFYLFTTASTPKGKTSKQSMVSAYVV